MAVEPSLASFEKGSVGSQHSKGTGHTCHFTPMGHCRYPQLTEVVPMLSISRILKKKKKQIPAVSVA
ncbi:hypothetical protein Tco_0005681 [Tanacetum coccineum]